MSEHPFLDNTFYVAWSNLRPEALEADITLALKNAQARIDAIAAGSGEATFSNTILALESASEELGRAWGYVSHLSNVEDSPSLREVYNKLLPQVSLFYTSIPLNAALWQRVRQAAQSAQAKAQSGVYARLLEETLADFSESGADLPQAQKEILQTVEQQLSALTQKYSENVLDATNAWEYVTTDAAELAGLPQGAIDAARKSAADKGHGSAEAPAWRFTQHYPSMLPVMQFADCDALRRRVWEGGAQMAATGALDNAPLLLEILQLRQKKAELLGFKDFSDLVTRRRMARSGSNALDFIENLHSKAQPGFIAEFADLQNFRREQLLAAGRSDEAQTPIEPWQTAYWSERLRQARYAYDEEALRPYFPLDSVIEGMFALCGRLFGISVRERASVFIDKDGREHTHGEPGDDEPVEVWHPQVRVYELYDTTGPGETLLGAFYTDWHPRESKRGGAWMDALRTGGPRADGSFAPHLGLIAGNMSEAINGKPALMTHDEVQTIFHEFGHLLHHLCGRVPVRSLNGIHVAWDFVELPSQILENWCWEREALDLFARHHESGEAIPEKLFAKMRRARTCMEAMATMRQLSLAKMDLDLHRRPGLVSEASQLDAAVSALLAQYAVPYERAVPPIVRRFTHIFGSPTGYAAGYYSYKWAEVLDADAFTRFQKEGVLNGQTGLSFRHAILEKGNSRPPQACFAEFMGRDPDPEALLRRAGILPG